VRWIGLGLFVLAIVMTEGCSGRGTAPTPGTDAAAQLTSLFEREWEWRMLDSPLFATSVGDHRYDDRLPSDSPESQRRRAEATDGFLRDLARIDPSRLSAADRISHDIFKLTLEERRDSLNFNEQLLPLNADSGFHTDFAQVRREMRFQSARDYEAYVSRLRAFPTYMDENMALLREGLRTGITIPRASLAGIETSIAPLAAEDPARSAFWEPFSRMPAAIPAVDRDRLQGEGRAALAEQVGPAYRRFLEFMTREYVPGARETLGASSLPNGPAYYRFLIRKFTTLDLAPEEVHRLGLEQARAIRAEMDAAIAATGFKGTFAAFLSFLRTDPRFYPKTGEQLLKEACYIAKRMDAKLPSLFGKLPRQPYGVAPVPEYLAAKYTAGRYAGAPLGEPGYYWVNTYALETRPLYNLEALTLHEAVPGHHLQIALAKELEGLPQFRRFTYFSAFGEGWGLYAEWLGRDAGFYTDPYSNFGRLTYAMWRAARLVVDTGIHAQGWTRQQAIDYLASNTALSLHECTTEIDRYISWPGQALSYKLGELKIRELRARAEAALGAKFDVRRFHDAVLANGAVPLPVLEGAIDRFVAAEKTR
jgi:uncharacterized protein (DUF885 family)